MEGRNVKNMSSDHLTKKNNINKMLMLINKDVTKRRVTFRLMRSL